MSTLTRVITTLIRGAFATKVKDLITLLRVFVGSFMFWVKLSTYTNTNTNSMVLAWGVLSSWGGDSSVWLSADLRVLPRMVMAEGSSMIPAASRGGIVLVLVGSRTTLDLLSGLMYSTRGPPPVWDRLVCDRSFITNRYLYDMPTSMSSGDQVLSISLSNPQTGLVSKFCFHF